ncbi:hypothetical protein CU052_19835 [Vibrio harveyi]|uniref:hypothetical protein n=1 Tax=Vibrio harveyi TaxID=669 RepID=UPI000C79D7ED|nr:hypothetical protein [Vibrio harveyi]AWB01504.1 hypothetical protein CU052_19835 [Vibrio harveyi]
MSLEEIKARFQEVSDTKEGLLALICELYYEEISSDDKVLEQALTELHNSGSIELVNIVSTVEKCSSRYDFFTILHAFENVLPSLDASIEDVLRCLVNLTHLAGRDLAAGGVYRAYERFCRMETNRPRDSVRFILEQSDVSAYAPFLSSSILSYGSGSVVEAIQTTERLIAIGNSAVRHQAYFTLGNIDAGELQACTIWEQLCSSVTNEEESGCRAAILRAILHFGEKFPLYWTKIEDLISTFSEVTHPEALYVISELTAFQRIDFPESVMNLLLNQLATIAPEHKGTIDNIDHLLVKLVEKGACSDALKLLESLVAADVEILAFDYFSRELLTKHRILLSHIITKWLLSGTSALCRGVSDLLNDVSGNDIELEAEMSVLGDEVKQEYVSRKAIGWLFTRPITATSLILSIYGIASSTTREKLEQILYSPLLLSYPGDLRRFFQSRIDSDIERNLCERLLKRLHDYQSDIDKISGMRELMAPSENVSLYWKELNKGMEEAHEEASKSSLMSLFTTQRLLYGNSSIYYLHKGDGEQVRQEMEMQSYSHSKEMPRLNVLDPETLDYTLQVYRYEGMKNEVDS